MRITRTDDPAKETKPNGERLEDMTTEDLQRTLTTLTTRRTLERDRAVLIRMITRLRKQKEDKLEAKEPTPTVTQRLVSIANMKLPELREEYQRVFGKPSLSRNRKALLVKIAEKLQADAAAPESPTVPVAKPTLTVKFERKGGKKAGGKGKRRAKGKAATQGKGTAATRKTTRPAGQRDPRLPKSGCVLERLYKGKKLLVTVTEDGFTFNGKPYRSLSSLAQTITGSAAINGFLFFRLGKYAKKEKAGK